MSAIVEAVGVRKWFPLKSGMWKRERAQVKALDGVSLRIADGETLGVVGESGCGKSTLGRVLLRLHEPTEGKILFDGEDLTALGREEMRQRRRDMQLIFQDPFSSLNPRMTAGTIIGEPLEIHEGLAGPQKRERVEELLKLVGLSPFHLRRYPHEFSGGQRQRISIARAIALNPRFVVCDE
jgi:ABC-type oligopeptide transport system ATPase subunit